MTFRSILDLNINYRSLTSDLLDAMLYNMGIIDPVTEKKQEAGASMIGREWIITFPASSFSNVNLKPTPQRPN